METKNQHFIYGGCKIELESDVENNELLDTRVTIEGHYLCYIAGTDIKRFKNGLYEFIDRYRI